MVRVMAAPEVRRHASQTHTTSASISHGEYAPGSDMVPRTGAAPLALMAVVRRNAERQTKFGSPKGNGLAGDQL